MGVEHDGGRDTRAWPPGRPPAADHDLGPRPCLGPASWQLRHAQPPATEHGRPGRRPLLRGRDDEHAAVPRRRRNDLGGVVVGREPQQVRARP